MSRDAGFSLIEVLVAMVILGMVMVSTQAMITSRFVRDVGMHDTRSLAVQVATDRLHLIQQDPSYATLGNYAGTEASNANDVAAPELVRTTEVNHTQTPEGLDYKRITVRVTGAGLAQPVVRTATVAAP